MVQEREVYGVRGVGRRGFSPNAPQVCDILWSEIRLHDVGQLRPVQCVPRPTNDRQISTKIASQQTILAFLQLFSKRGVMILDSQQLVIEGVFFSLHSIAWAHGYNWSDSGLSSTH